MNDFVECKTEKFVSERYSKNVKSLASAVSGLIK